MNEPDSVIVRVGNPVGYSASIVLLGYASLAALPCTTRMRARVACTKLSQLLATDTVRYLLQGPRCREAIVLVEPDFRATA
jgi:hypothetical protein